VLMSFCFFFFAQAIVSLHRCFSMIHDSYAYVQVNSRLARSGVHVQNVRGIYVYRQRNVTSGFRQVGSL